MQPIRQANPLGLPREVLAHEHDHFILIFRPPRMFTEGQDLGPIEFRLVREVNQEVGCVCPFPNYLRFLLVVAIFNQPKRN